LQLMPAKAGLKLYPLPDKVYKTSARKPLAKAKG